MKIPLLDLKTQYELIRGDVEAAIRDVMESQQFILGPRVEECERAVAAYCGSRYGVGVSSGTDALLMCLMAEHIGPGDEVITTPYTFFATAGCISRVGATPVFVDIDPVTYNLDPAQIKAKLTERTRAIMPVHLYGQAAEMAPIVELATEQGLVIIEDAAQAIGAEYNGRRVGTLGQYGCFSFFPSKNLAGAGDGGLIVTDDGERRDQLVRLRAHGSKPKYYHGVVGGNFRLDALQAAIVSAKLPYLEAWTEGRRGNAERYGRLFAASGLRITNARTWASMSDADRVRADRPQIVLPSVVEQRHVFNQYVVRMPGRDEVKKRLQAKGVATEIYYPVPMHLQECFKDLGHKRGDFPQSELAADETLALPIYPELTDEQAAYVVRSITECLQG
jgi:dTDP-4-amino-4,6-dideoxygalactose transaminase